MLPLCDLAKQIDQCEVFLSRFRSESGNDIAEICLVELRGFIDLAGEEAGAERAEAHETDSEFFEHGQEICFRTTVEEGILALDRSHWLDGVCTPNRGDSRFREAEVLDPALLDRLLDRPCYVLDRYRRIDAMLLKQIDHIDLQVPERGFCDGLDVLWTAVETGAAYSSG